MTRDIENLTQAECEELYQIPDVQDELGAIQSAPNDTDAATHMGALARLVSLYGKGMIGNS